MSNEHTYNTRLNTGPRAARPASNASASVPAAYGSLSMPAAARAPAQYLIVPVAMSPSCRVRR
jgi:hypothetical protein